jgi:DNA helicase-2/ATP-dependent DNA helicase PcrA
MIIVKKDETLNEHQRLAVTSPDGPILVIAGAGTGKTKTLVHRMLHLVSNGISPDSLLLLTFTRRASKQMLTRASQLLDRRMENVSGGTFHSFSNHFLRRYATKVGFTSNFSILDTEDATTLVGLSRENVISQKVAKRFPKKETIFELISTSFNTNLSLEKTIQKDYPQFIREIKEIQLIREDYEKAKFKANCMDFDDLLHFTRKILVEDQVVRSHSSQKYQAILVDEYQDTNRIQAHIACLIASEHANIMVVGDDAQSIYGFRGSDVRNIFDFPKIFKNTQIIKLEENFRSTPNILNLANRCLTKFQEKYDKKLFTKKIEAGQIPKVFKYSSIEEEADQIAQRILTEYELGTSFNEIAILGRSGWHTNIIEIALTSKGIPFKKYGGKRILEQAHIKDILAYLRVISNPLDWISWNRILLLEENVGPKQTSYFLQAIQNQPDLFIEQSNWENDVFFLGFTKEAKISLSRLLNFLHLIFIKRNQSVLAIYEETLTYYSQILQIKFDDHEKRMFDLESLKVITKERRSLEDFLSILSLDATESFQMSLDQKEDEFVTISTIHSAKGLEWNSVFIVHLIDGHFPSNRIRTNEELEEERRLFYVAVTRAKSKLFFTIPLTEHGNSIQLQAMSRFLEEMNGLPPVWKEETDSEIEQKKGNSDQFDHIQNYFLN